MSEYKLNSILNEDKLFLINLSELEARIDPLFYASDLQKFNKTNHTSYALKSVCQSFSSGFGAGKDDQSNSENGIIHVRPTNIDRNGFAKFDKNIYVPKNLKSNKIEVDSVLFNNTNSQELVGKTLLGKNVKGLFFSNHITKINVNKELIYPYYLWMILNIYQRNSIFYSICTNWNNQSGIGLDLLKNLKIPVPNKPFQKKLIDNYQNAIRVKDEKQKESKKLLESIDTYLLTELGITIPEKDNSLENRVFYTKISEVANGRFDPKLYDNNTKAIRTAIQNSNYKDKPRLKDLVIHSVAGDWGKDLKDTFTKKQQEEHTKSLVIRATEFDNLYNLKLDNSRVKYRLIDNNKLKRIDVQPNDLLIEKSGGSPDQPVGRISIIRKKLINKHNLGYSNFIHKIRVNTNRIHPEYLFCFLKTVHNIKLTDAMQSQTNGIRNLIMSNYFDQIIPLPNFDKQTEIATHINSLRTRAKELEIEAKQVIKIANKEIEKLILEE